MNTSSLDIEGKKKRLDNIEAELTKIKGDFSNALDIQLRIAELSPPLERNQIRITANIGRVFLQHLVARIERNLDTARTEVTHLEQVAKEIEEKNQDNKRLGD